MLELAQELLLHHQRFDQSVDAWISRYSATGGKIFCAQGCHGCCSLVVNCQFAEAAQIASLITKDQATRIALHVSRLLEMLNSVTDLPSYLRLHRSHMGPCPLLDESGCCSIYPQRPFACRSLLATKDNTWCSTDFTKLSRDEKRAFIESIDRSIAAFPMHYVAATQELGREMESLCALKMQENFGFSIYGNLVLLVHLEHHLGLSSELRGGMAHTVKFLEERGFLAPFVITFEE
jgi:Fe-S-cluster containining protein